MSRSEKAAVLLLAANSGVAAQQAGVERSWRAARTRRAKQARDKPSRSGDNSHNAVTEAATQSQQPQQQPQQSAAAAAAEDAAAAAAAAAEAEVAAFARRFDLDTAVATGRSTIGQGRRAHRRRFLGGDPSLPRKTGRESLGRAVCRGCGRVEHGEGGERFRIQRACVGGGGGGEEEEPEGDVVDESRPGHGAAGAGRESAAATSAAARTPRV